MPSRRGQHVGERAHEHAHLAVERAHAAERWLHSPCVPFPLAGRGLGGEGQNLRPSMLLPLTPHP